VTFSTARVSASCCGLAGFRFFFERVDGRDAEDVAFELAVEVVVLENDVEGLIPRHVIEDEREVALHSRIQNNVESVIS